MLRAIPDVYIVIVCPGCDYVGILRLVSRLVDFTRVNDPLYNGILDGLLGCTVAAEFLGGGVVVFDACGGRIRKVDVCDLDVVGSGA